jgi:hypothetical protein
MGIIKQESEPRTGKDSRFRITEKPTTVRPVDGKVVITPDGNIDYVFRVEQIIDLESSKEKPKT